MSSSIIFLLLIIVKIRIFTFFLLLNLETRVLRLLEKKLLTIFKTQILGMFNFLVYYFRVIKRRSARSIYSSTIILPLRINPYLLGYPWNRIRKKWRITLNIYLLFSYYRGIRRLVQFSRERSSLLIEITVHKTGRESGKQSGGTK